MPDQESLLVPDIAPDDSLFEILDPGGLEPDETVIAHGLEVNLPSEVEDVETFALFSDLDPVELSVDDTVLEHVDLQWREMGAPLTLDVVDPVGFRPSGGGIAFDPNILPAGPQLPSTPTLMTERAAIALLRRYLAAQPRVRACLVWGFGQQGWDDRRKLGDPAHWKAFDNWPQDMKTDLEQIVARMMILPGPQLAVRPDKTAFTLDEVAEAYLVFAAHSLVLDMHQLVPWRLADFPEAHLRWLLDGRYFAYSLENDRDTASHGGPHPGYQFGVIEKLHSVYSTSPDYFPLPAQCLPADPHAVFQKAYNDMGVSRATTIRQAIGFVSRWVQDNIRHGAGEYQFLFKNWSWIKPYYPPMDVILFERMDPTRVRRLKNNLVSESELRQMGLPPGVAPRDLIDVNGVVADPLIGSAQGYIGFTRHSLYNGCQAGGGFLQWLFRSINLPAKSFASYLDHGQSGNYPNAFHRSIEVSDGHRESLAIPHADNLYQAQGVSNGGASYTLDFFDPHIDLTQIFWPKSSMRTYLPDYPAHVRRAPAARDRQQYERYQSWMIATGAAYGFAAYVLPWWTEWERVGRDEAQMSVANVPWLGGLATFANPFDTTGSKVSAFAVHGVKKRIAEIEAGQNTLWGTTLTSYRAGYQQWQRQRNANRVRYYLWRR